jgi:predicted nucleic acid-binding protein
LEEEVILVDTNAWVHHLRAADTQLVVFLKQQRVRTCDVVIGELLLGSGLPKTFARDLQALPKLPSPTALETRLFVERHARTFGGSGVGWADAQIMLSAARSGARIHTSDRSVKRVCTALGIPIA